MLNCVTSQKKLCGQKNCKICFNRSLSSYEGRTKNGKLKIECWDIDKNNGIKPDDITMRAGHKKWFQCDICNHHFETVIYAITAEKCSWCPYCANKKLCGDKNCVDCFDKSIASFKEKTINEKLKINCWSIQNKIEPRNVFSSSHKKYSFDCDICSHTFESTVYNIIKSQWCSYCTNKYLCNDDNCDMCYNNSFASYKGKTVNKKLKVDCWDNEKNGNVKPRDIFKTKNQKYFFKCDNCPHYIYTSPASIASKGNWCYYCCIPTQQLCEEPSCDHCFNRSFASYEGKTSEGRTKLSCWSTKNENIMPRDLKKYTNKKYWFQCDICDYEFDTILNNIVSKNHWCPKCANKTEKIFHKWLKDNYGHDINYQAKFDWCKNPETNKHLPFDFCIEELKLIIEVDGRQHFEQVANWNSPEHNFNNDEYKMKKALEKGYTIIRILQEDIFNDKNNWEENTKNAIKQYRNPQVVCIGCEKKYERHNDVSVERNYVILDTMKFYIIKNKYKRIK
jgi:hypothetical protein